MTPSKINLYNSFSDEEKHVLKQAALKACSISANEISLPAAALRAKSPKTIKSILDTAVKYDLLTYERHEQKYYAEVDFMLYIYPELTGFGAYWEAAQKQKKGFEGFYRFYSNVTALQNIRNCLYSLLFLSKEEYRKYEEKCVMYPSDSEMAFYGDLIRSEKYEPYLCRLSEPMMEKALFYIANDAIYNLESLPETVCLFEKIERLSKYPNVGKCTGISDALDFFAGRFKDIKEMDVEILGSSALFIAAASKVIEGSTGEAFTLFGTGMKIQRIALTDFPFPASPYFAIYYLALLLNMDAKGVAIMQKIKLWMQKNSEFSTIFILSVELVIDHALNRKSEVERKVAALLKHLKEEETELTILSLVSLLFLHMAGKKPDSGYMDSVLKVVQKAYRCGYAILAYEAAYAAQAWYESEELKELFRKMADELSYQPVMSRISQQEDWEKSLNMLLGLKPATPRTAAGGESKTRVVYYFNPAEESVQPVLQTRQAKGWSAGRNIALKSFYEGKTQGMTPQDMLVAKAIKREASYYDEYFEFSQKVFPALVAHPYIFLANSKDIPVELVAAQPVITVAKKSRGYELSSDVQDFQDKIFLQKETNTRYKVYNLTAMQVQMLQIISEQKLVIPEAGREKLIALLGTFSAQGMDVHSDLLDSESAQTTVKEVPADSRIRVQLLPFGDGLKAELFVKPFGAHPPYCKPGKGGRVLIANEKDVQLQVKRNLKEEASNEALLLNEIQALESLTITNGLMAFDDPLDALHLLDILAKLPGICVVEWPEGERYKIRGTADFSQLKLKVASNVNWFDLQGELKVDENTVISLQKLLALTEHGHNRFIELSPGEFIALSKELKKQLDSLRLYTTVSKDEVRLNKFASVAMDDFFGSVADLKADKAWQKFRERLNDNLSEIAVPSTLQAELRSYQEEGFRWMSRLAAWEGGACLADDMGLGKTVQTLALLLHRAAEGPALVVCPVSVVGSWVAEAGRFAPTLRIKTMGSATHNRQEVLRSLEAGDLLITSYGLLQSEEKLFSEPSFATVVLDEAHAIKNYATKTSKASMQLKAAFRVALTGTPVQNHLGEVWNLFNFTNPGLLGSLQHFTDRFIKTDDEEARRRLKKLIAPFILRRTKSAVLDELPPKTEIVKKIQLSSEEMAFYEALRRQAIENLSDGAADGAGANLGAKRMQVLAEITKLRQASCNPLLIDKDIR
ncbi:MAG: DEAD/DEAH box helicase family protein, partial [Prevotellaceae bacterium]|nr:DEAD/DEAH box helicase family protein [Prevotellaceae bacterium]